MREIIHTNIQPQGLLPHFFKRKNEADYRIHAFRFHMGELMADPIQRENVLVSTVTGCP